VVDTNPTEASWLAFRSNLSWGDAKLQVLGNAKGYTGLLARITRSSD
jgi:hypothetical protein